MTTKLTLLEKALMTPVHRSNGNYNTEEIDVALAWLQGMVSITQVGFAMKIPAGSAQSRMSKLLRHAYETGRLVVKDVE